MCHANDLIDELRGKLRALRAEKDRVISIRAKKAMAFSEEERDECRRLLRKANARRRKAEKPVDLILVEIETGSAGRDLLDAIFYPSPSRFPSHKEAFESLMGES